MTVDAKDQRRPLALDHADFPGFELLFVFEVFQVFHMMNFKLDDQVFSACNFGSLIFKALHLRISL
jgi:hypothetical protein